jgi:tetratricopeptide (TPR) repeat protein
MRRAFVSHSTADDSFVAEMESFLRAAGFDDVFNDVHAIKPDEQLWPRIEKGITDCNAFVVVITAAATNSEWVKREVALARRLGKRVIPVWREDCLLPPDFSDRDVIDFRLRTRKERRIDIDRIVKYAPAELMGREDETKLLNDAWQKTLRLEKGRPHVLTFVALGGEGKTSLIAKWAAELAGQDWPGCDAAFAWSFYSQGTREQLAASSDLFLKEALTFFGDEAMAGSAAGAFEKGRRLAHLVGERRALLILDGLEPLQYAPTSPTPGELKDQGLAALLRGLAAASHGLCLVTTRYSLLDLKAFWQTTAPEVKLLRLSRDAGVHLLKQLGVKGSELRNIPLDSPSQTEAPKRATHDSPGQRPGLAAQQDSSALKGRDKTVSCNAPTGHDDLGNAETQGVALGCHIAGRWPARSPDGRELVNEYEKLVEDVKGHALTLTLLGGFLKRAFHGDIRQRDRVKFEKADEKMDGGHAFRTMAAYEQWLLRDGGDEGQREVAVLRLMGLFDRPAGAGCLLALRGETIPGLTEPLVGLADEDWEFCLSGLEAAKLLTVNRAAAGALVSLDAHPLLREYFARQLRAQQPDAWRAAHRRLYEHLCATTTDKPQPSLQDLQPLYQAVAHGCQAGLHADVAVNIYRFRIHGGGEGLLPLRHLGAFAMELGMLKCFFSSGWEHPVAELPPEAQAWLLNQASLCLKSVGRTAESLDPVRAALAIQLRREDYANAAVGFENLGLTQLQLGQVTDAISSGRQAVSSADRSADSIQRVCSRTTLADILHQAGNHADALTLFRSAEALFAQTSRYPFLYSEPGFAYWNCILAKSEKAAWRRQIAQAKTELLSIPFSQEPATVDLRTCQEVKARAEATLAWVKVVSNTNLDVSLNQLTLGRAEQYEAITEGTSIDPCHAFVEQAMDGLRRAGSQDQILRGLLTRAWLRFLIGACTGPESAQADLDEAWEIAERGPMRLHMADIHLYRARLFFREKQYPWESPAADLAAAEKLINECGYHRRDEELADAKRAILGT